MTPDDPLAARRRAVLTAAIPDLPARLPRFDTGIGAVEADIFASFLEYLSQLADELTAAIRQSAPERVRAIGHSIKGMGGSCGAPEVSVLGEELEIAARAGELSRCEALVAALRAWCSVATA